MSPARKLRRQQLSTDAQALFEALSRAEALERLASFQTAWGPLELEVARMLTQDIELSLTCYQFDVAVHAHIRSTNLLERCFREFRTKADEMGAFPNELEIRTAGEPRSGFS